MNTTQTIVGQWSVVEQQRRIHGEWIREYDFLPGEWEMNFYPNGRMSEDFHPPGHPLEFNVGSWDLDRESGIILLRFDEVPESCDASGVVFDGSWLYFFENGPHIRPDRDTIIDHHAHERQKLETKL